MPYFCVSCFCSCGSFLYLSKLTPLWLFLRLSGQPGFFSLDLFQSSPGQPPIPEFNCDSNSLPREGNSLGLLLLESELEQCHRMGETGLLSF